MPHQVESERIAVPRASGRAESVERVVTAHAMRRRDSVRAVRDLIRHELLESEWSGERVLPTETELAREHCTGRNVIRLALEALSAEGIVERVPGSGTFLRRRKLRVRHLRLEGLALGLASNGSDVHYEPQLMEFRPAPGAVAAALGVEVGDRVAVIERRSYYGDQTASFNSRFLPAGVADAMLEAGDLSTSDWFSALERAAGAKIAGARTVVEAGIADIFLAPELDVAVGAPVILMHRTVSTVDGTVVEFNLTRSRGDLISIETWTERA